MLCPCDIDGFCPYSNDPTTDTCDTFCDYPDNYYNEEYDNEETITN